MARFLNITDKQANDLAEKKETPTTSKSTKVGYKCLEDFEKETDITYDEHSLTKEQLNVVLVKFYGGVRTADYYKHNSFRKALNTLFSGIS